MLERAAEVVAPHPVEDLRLAEHPARVAHQVPQQLELGGGELDGVAAAAHLVAVFVEHEVADAQHGVAASLITTASAADEAAQAGTSSSRLNGLVT